ncbi:dTDP-4-dehydrorhamnose 3,5-epimerase family protein [Bryobacter aggregatus]|uniref:dTDP-4-dehydrorhamnose 3,5-epimerase family protein n=1 Tax=Bryobacter aggregatus TaxID=360054 RepID=UPI0009B59D78|nr:dTDP-4-dehydrorhamnose 3,5-epimerase family protein [Bryobacter aggregatus]
MSEPKILMPELWAEANTPGIGAIVRATTDKGVIAGVEISPYPIFPDDRGYFLEVARIGQGLVSQFPAATTQVSAALSYPGTIKAFHYHRHQTDFWVPVMGVFQVGLVDLREDSPTFRMKNTIYCGGLKPLQIIIPPGVGHGYKVVSPENGMLVYVTDRQYNPADEGRIVYNHSSIAYDWETQFK